VRAKAVVFGHATPICIDHLGAIRPRADAVLPMIFIRKTTSRPTNRRDLDIFQGSDHIVAYAAGIGNGAVFPHPDTAVNAVPKVFGELPIDVLADGVLAGLGVHHQRVGDWLRPEKKRYG